MEIKLLLHRRMNLSLMTRVLCVVNVIGDDYNEIPILILKCQCVVKWCINRFCVKCGFVGKCFRGCNVILTQYQITMLHSVLFKV